MTVSTTTNRVSYNGNGTTVDFATPYFIVDADVYVYVDGVLLTLATDYTLTGAGVAGGGTVSCVVAPATGTGNVVILVSPALTQLLDLVENDKNPAGTRETAFDKLTLIAQRISDRLDRAVQLLDYDTTASMYLPVAADRASQYLAFDASGNVLMSPAAAGSAVVSPFMATVLDDVDAPTARATLGATTVGDALFTAVDVAGAKATLLLDTATTHNFTSDADYTLTSTQEGYGRVVLTDTTPILTVGRNVLVSTTEDGRWYDNGTLQDLTVKTSAGTGIVVPAGKSRYLICDGTNVVDPLTAFVQDTDSATIADVQTGTNTTTYVTPSSLRGGLIVSATAQTATGVETFFDFTGIPAWAKKITVMFNELSTNGTANLLVQIGSASGLETTGYVSESTGLVGGTTPSTGSSTSGFLIQYNAAANNVSGHVLLTHLGSNTWVESHTTRRAATATMTGGGDKTLAGALTQLRITTSTGTDLFDAGSVNIMYE